MSARVTECQKLKKGKLCLYGVDHSKCNHMTLGFKGLTIISAWTFVTVWMCGFMSTPAVKYVLMQLKFSTWWMIISADHLWVIGAVRCNVSGCGFKKCIFESNSLFPWPWPCDLGMHIWPRYSEDVLWRFQELEPPRRARIDTHTHYHATFTGDSKFWRASASVPVASDKLGEWLSMRFFSMG